MNVKKSFLLQIQKFCHSILAVILKLLLRSSLAAGFGLVKIFLSVKHF
jgi:hypothetical protein